MEIVPSDHVRGALVTPAIDWLGQLVVDRHRAASDLAHLLGAGDRDLLLQRPEAEAWVPSHSARRLVGALLEVHGGRTRDVLRELGRRTTEPVGMLAEAPDERLALRLSHLIRVGRWRPARLCLPGDLVELSASQPLDPTMLGWIGGLLDGVLQRRCVHAPGRLRVGVVARVESPTHAVFVRCGY